MDHRKGWRDTTVGTAIERTGLVMSFSADAFTHCAEEASERHRLRHSHSWPESSEPNEYAQDFSFQGRTPGWKQASLAYSHFCLSLSGVQPWWIRLDDGLARRDHLQQSGTLPNSAILDNLDSHPFPQSSRYPKRGYIQSLIQSFPTRFLEMRDTTRDRCVRYCCSKSTVLISDMREVWNKTSAPITHLIQSYLHPFLCRHQSCRFLPLDTRLSLLFSS